MSHQLPYRLQHQLLPWLQHFFVTLFKRCEQDKVRITAGYLAYVTLLSLVPMLAVMFAMFSAFPVFDQLQGEIEAFVFSNFIPTAGDVVQEHLNGFIKNASKMTSVGILALVAVALLLISAIDKSLNDIWRVEKHRRWLSSFSIYWMVLTLGPVLLATSLAATSYLVSLDLLGQLGGLKTSLFKLIPFASSVLVFLGLYLMVPNKIIQFRHALVGAVVGAALFELSKRLFALYITHVPSYQAIYGALATIPILFIWIYLSWLVVLFGAETTATLGELQPTKSLPDEDNLEDQL